MKSNRATLLSQLESLKPGLSGAKEVLEQSTSFVFKDGWVFTFNNYVACSREIGLELEGAVRAQEMIDLLRSVDDEEVKIEVEEDQLVVKGRDFEAGIAFDDEVLMPLEDVPEPEEWFGLPDNFKQAIKITSISAAKSSPKPILECIHFNGDVAETCDNFRITRFKLDSMVDEMIIPAEIAKQLLNYELSAFATDEGWAHFQQEDEEVIISCRLQDGDYPDLKSFIDDEEGDEITFPKQIQQAAEQARIFTRSQMSNEVVLISISKKEITVKGESATGWIEKTIPAKSKSEIDFSINPEFLLKLVAMSHQAIVLPGKLILKAEDFTHMVLLVAESE